MKNLFVYFSIISAVVFAEKCVVYKEGDELPPEPIGGRSCFEVMNDTNIYCIDFNCPAPECSNPIQIENGCPFCNGTCTHGGKVYKAGDGFECADRCNSCSCSEHGLFQTLMACFFAEPPKECQT